MILLSQIYHMFYSKNIKKVTHLATAFEIIKWAFGSIVSSVGRVPDVAGSNLTRVTVMCL